MTEEAVWHIVKDFAKSLGVAKSAASRSAPDLCSALPRFRGQVGTDPMPFGPRIGSNDRTLPWLQAADLVSGE